MHTRDFVLQSDWYHQTQVPEVDNFSYKCYHAIFPPSVFRLVMSEYILYIMCHLSCSPQVYTVPHLLLSWPCVVKVPAKHEKSQKKDENKHVMMGSSHFAYISVRLLSFCIVGYISLTSPTFCVTLPT